MQKQLLISSAEALVGCAVILLGVTAGYGYLWLKYLRDWPLYSAAPRT